MRARARARGGAGGRAHGSLAGERAQESARQGRRARARARARDRDAVGYWIVDPLYPLGAWKWVTYGQLALLAADLRAVLAHELQVPGLSRPCVGRRRRRRYRPPVRRRRTRARVWDR